MRRGMAHWREMVMFRWNVTVKSMAKGDRQRVYDVIALGVCASYVALQKRQVLQIRSVIEALGIPDARHMRHLTYVTRLTLQYFSFPHIILQSVRFSKMLLSKRLVF
jgi:hypothetical protein